jgi:hypothetical protein
MGVWFLGNMGVWFLGNMGVWFLGNMGVWFLGNMDVWFLLRGAQGAQAGAEPHPQSDARTRTLPSAGWKVYRQWLDTQQLTEEVRLPRNYRNRLDKDLFEADIRP